MNEDLPMSEHDAPICGGSDRGEHAHARTRIPRGRVGAAKPGRIFTGCNVENSTYGLTLWRRAASRFSKPSPKASADF